MLRLTATITETPTVGALGKLERRVASDATSYAIRVVIKPKARTLGVLQFRVVNRTNVLRGYLTGLQDLGFAGAVVPRNHSPATRPVALVRPARPTSGE